MTRASIKIQSAPKHADSDAVKLVEGQIDKNECSNLLFRMPVVDTETENIGPEPAAEALVAAAPAASTAPAAPYEKPDTRQGDSFLVAAPEPAFSQADTSSAAVREMSLARLAKAFSPLDADLKSIFSWLWGLRTPLFLLGAIALQPKLVLLWVLIVLAKPISTWIYQRCPNSWKQSLAQVIPARFKSSSFIRDLGEGADQGLPFVLFWLYLFCLPFALLWICSHWLKALLPEKQVPQPEHGFLFAQNRRADSASSENNFYYSKSFGPVFLAFFALGIPAIFTYSLYHCLGIERLLDSQPMKPVRYSVFGYKQPQSSALESQGMQSAIVRNATPPPPILARPVRWLSLPLAEEQLHPAQRQDATPHQLYPVWTQLTQNATVVVRYGGVWPQIFGQSSPSLSPSIIPTRYAVLFVHFYLVSVASALSVILLRAWFLFPLNFLADEHDLEFSPSGIRRKSLKSWFLSVLTINRWAAGGGPDTLLWTEIKSIRRIEEGFTRLCPLPETAFKRESLAYKLLNKVAALLDGLSNRPDKGNYLIFSAAKEGGDFGRNIRLNLNDLSREQRARLYYSVKQWAPQVLIQSSAEEQLLGSTVLQDARYTQLWFDLLTGKSRVRQNVLMPGETLKNGAYTIDERLSSGGQATAYLARNASGEHCVLKEFILAGSSGSGILIESAREFEAEVSLLSQLDHPGIVKLQDFFSEDGRVYVALEYIEGCTLRQKVQQCGPLSEQETIRIASNVCDVLRYLHNSAPPIVHRDITPENIIIKSDGTVKLIDFSLAVKHGQRNTTDSCGKQSFTPPEQFRDEVCVQSDIYALGATMYYLLTGRVPKPISVSSPRNKVESISSELNTIVERATQPDLSARYESVDWLKLDLTNVAATGQS